MKHKTWFRLVVKAIGILLIGLGLPDLLNHIVAYVTQRLYMAGSGSAFSGIDPEWLVVVLYLLAPLLQVCIGLYLLFGGAWIVNLCVPSNRPYCPECGYDLSQSKDRSTCSECGTAQPTA